MSSMPYESAQALRMLALMHLLVYLPCDYPYPKPKGSIGKDRFRRVTNDVWTWPATTQGVTVSTWAPGTTCGFLTNWLAWALGSRDGKTINRTDTAWNNAKGSQVSSTGGPIIYLQKQNIARTVFDMAAVPQAKGGYVPSGTSAKYAYRSWFTNNNTASDDNWGLARPRLGDLVYIRRPSGDPKEHVFVFLEEIVEGGVTYWLTADGGQLSVAGTPYKLTCASAGLLKAPPYSFLCFNKRKVTWKPLTGETIPRPWIDGTRYVDGWLDLERLPLGAWTWDAAGGALPALDPAVVDLLPQAWTFPDSTSGKQQRAAWELAAALAVQTFWDWYYENWQNNAQCASWAFQVVSALSGSLGQGPASSPTVGDAAPPDLASLEAARAVARALKAKLVEEQRADGTLTLALEGSDEESPGEEVLDALKTTLSRGLL